jgi:hypothetical protein
LLEDLSESDDLSRKLPIKTKALKESLISYLDHANARRAIPRSSSQ